MKRRHICLGVLAAVCLAQAGATGALDLRDLLSPYNRLRPLRSATDYIVLHTTEAPPKGSLQEVYAKGETHFLVDWRGVVYRIIDRRRVALHAGRSMWEGRTNLDDYSIGIEVVGYHDHDITPAQYAALKELLDELQQIYRIPDERVLTHSMVAYGTPNRWLTRSHRGRKRCGMLFALPAVRTKLGLDGQPAGDPDVAAGRLTIGDPYLARMLYPKTNGLSTAISGPADQGSNVVSQNRSAWDIARDRYKNPDVLYYLPDGRTLRGNQIADWNKIPFGTRIVDRGDSSANASDGLREIGVDGNSVTEIAGDEYAAPTTIYLLADGRAKKGNELTNAEFTSLGRGTRVLVGYSAGGTVTTKRSAYDICGARWSSPETYYRFPNGAIRPGAEVDDRTIPRGTQIYLPN